MNVADSIILIVMALLVLGPKRPPEIRKELGQARREFQEMVNRFDQGPGGPDGPLAPT